MRILSWVTLMILARVERGGKQSKRFVVRGGERLLRVIGMGLPTGYPGRVMEGARQ